MKRARKGADLAELQLRLAGFRGTVPDGDFGPGIERQVMNFRRDFMGEARPSGVVDRAAMQAIDAALLPGESKRDDLVKCDAIRGRIVASTSAQIGWTASNPKSLEPSDIAPTWVHYDVRSYEPKYLKDEMFCTTLKALDNRKPIRF